MNQLDQAQGIIFWPAKATGGVVVRRARRAHITLLSAGPRICRSATFSASPVGVDAVCLNQAKLLEHNH